VVRHRVAARGGAALLAVAAGLAAAQPAAEAGWQASAEVLHRSLRELAEDGHPLVHESGAMLRLGVAREWRAGAAGALRAEAGVAGGGLDYRGQTQAGAPLQTRTGQRELGLALAWRPLAPAAGGEAWLTLSALQQRRRIASTPQALGLRETSTLLSPGLRWSTRFEAAGWRWQPSLEVRASVHHRLEVGFGGVFDDARLQGGRRRELALGLQAGPTGSPWQWGLAWSQARQAASEAQAIRRGGAPAGTARQPRIRIADFGLRVAREF
jgi:hypothetical protein